MKDKDLKGFYIYPWSLEDVFVPPTVHDVRRKFYDNCGIGEQIYDNVYETSPYSLFDYSLHRLGSHSLRVSDTRDAKLFFIPFDVTQNTWIAAGYKSNDSNSSSFRRRLRRREDKLSYLRKPELAYKRLHRVISYLNSSTSFTKNKGRDHFFIENDSPYFSWKHGVSLWKEFHDYCTLCYAITPDVTTALKDKYRNIVQPSKVLAAPHPSSVHFSRSAPWMAHSNEEHRKILVSAVGTVQKAEWRSTRIRQILEHQCKLSDQNAYNLPDNMTICQQMHLSRNSYKRFRTVDAISIYKKSVFCLCAPGDLDVRKALFDILGVGCIPVTFSNSTAGEYAAYLGDFNDVVVNFGFDGIGIVHQNISVSLSSAHVRPTLASSIQKSVNVIDYLKNLWINNMRTVQKMQQNIQMIAKRVTYSVVGGCDSNSSLKHGVPDFDPKYKNLRQSSSPSGPNYYGPDAADIFLGVLFQRVAL